jgi:hypothetical protein
MRLARSADRVGRPFRPASWRAAVAVVLQRCAGELGRVRRLGEARFIAAVRRQLPRWGVPADRARCLRRPGRSCWRDRARGPASSSGCTWP